MHNETAMEKLRRLQQLLPRTAEYDKPALLKEMNQLVGRVQHLNRCKTKTN